MTLATLGDMRIDGPGEAVLADQKKGQVGMFSLNDRGSGEDVVDNPALRDLATLNDNRLSWGRSNTVVARARDIVGGVSMRLQMGRILARWLDRSA